MVNKITKEQKVNLGPDYKKALQYDWKKRPLSWSAISSFEWDPEQWHHKYVEHGPCTKDFCFVMDMPWSNCPVVATSKEMEFGKFIGGKLENDPTFLPMIPRFSKMEHPFESVKFGKVILVGYADTFCDKTFCRLGEFKTGKKAWDQKRVDSHGQLDMYLLMNFIQNKIKPEDMQEVFLAWMPTRDNGDFSISFIEPIEKNIKIFPTKRTTADVLRFGVRINTVFKKMEEYVKHRAK